MQKIFTYKLDEDASFEIQKLHRIFLIARRTFKPYNDERELQLLTLFNNWCKDNKCNSPIELFFDNRTDGKQVFEKVVLMIKYKKKSLYFSRG